MLTYIASPYSHPDPQVKVERYLAAVKAVAFYMKRGEFVFSPIVHSHPPATLHDMSGDFEFWRNYDTEMISKCDKVVVLMLDGWKKSEGVQSEIVIANGLGIPVMFMEPASLDHRAVNMENLVATG